MRIKKVNLFIKFRKIHGTYALSYLLHSIIVINKLIFVSSLCTQWFSISLWFHSSTKNFFLSGKIILKNISPIFLTYFTLLLWNIFYFIIQCLTWCYLQGLFIVCWLIRFEFIKIQVINPLKSVWLFLPPSIHISTQWSEVTLILEKK